MMSNAIAAPALARIVKGSREWDLAWREVAAHDAGNGICQEPEAGWSYKRTIVSPSGVGIVHEFASLYCHTTLLHIQATRAYRQMGTGRRDRRRQAVEAHFAADGAIDAICEHCRSRICGPGWMGTSLAVYDMPACGIDCALVLIGADAASDRRATVEMAPLSGADVEDERASRRKARAAEEERMLAAAGVSL